jgi:hypothetical protein
MRTTMVNSLSNFILKRRRRRRRRRKRRRRRSVPWSARYRIGGLK